MSFALEILLGLVGGTIAVATAIYVAVRPYVKAYRPKSWMPDPTGEAPPNHYEH